MTTCFGKSCSFGLLCVSFMGVCQILYSVYCACLLWAFVKFYVCPSFPSDIEGRMWVVIVLILDQYHSIYFGLAVG